MTTAGAQGDGLSVRPVVSRDGGFIAFSSHATNLVPDDTNDMGDAFLVDMSSGETTRVSLRADGEQASGGSPFTSTYPLAITTDGTRVSLETESDLVDDDTNGQTADLFIRNVNRGRTRLISVAAGGGAANSDSSPGALTVGGRHVAFPSHASDLVSGDTNDEADIFARSR